MENCFVTKLKGVIDNPNLDLFDAFKVRIKKWNSGGFSIKNSDGIQFGGTGVRYIAIDNCTMPNGEIEYIMPENPSGTIKIMAIDSTKDAEFWIVGISKIERLHDNLGGGIEIKDPFRLKYLETHDGHFPLFYNIDSTGMFDVYGDFSDNAGMDYGEWLNDIFAAHPEINKSDVTSFRMATDNPNNHASLNAFSRYVNITSIPVLFRINRGDLQAVKNLTELTELRLSNVHGKEITGNVINLAKCTNITNIRLGGKQVGELRSLVESQYDNGRLTGSVSLTIDEGNTNITFDGERIEGEYTLSWTDRDNVTLTPVE